MSIGRNVTANYLGQAWTAVIGLVFIPVYIRYMGVESFGLIGVFTLLQAWLALLDMGMTPTLNREMARFTAGAHTPQSIRDLLRSLELIALAMSAAIGVLVWAAADWLAADWLRVEKLPLETVSQAIALMGLVVAMRFLEGLYRGAMLGLQQQVLYNAANAFFATLRAAGAVAVLAWVEPTIGAYFVWQGIVSLLALAYMAVAVHRLLPSSPRPPRYSGRAVRDIWRFAGGMMATTFLVLLLMQVDKILLSRLLSLEVFGYYALATAVSGGLAMVVNPVSQAFFPRFSEMVARGDGEGIARNYHLAAQVASVFVAPIALMLIFFGRDIMALWTGDAELAREVTPLLALLALGNLLNGMMHIPYALQLAHGWPGLAAKINLAAVLVLVPAILWATPRFGAVGAAIVWVALNTGYVLLGVQMMHRRLMGGEKVKWYVQDVAKPMLAAAVAMLVCWLLQSTHEDRVLDLAWICFNAVLAYAAAFMASSDLRDHVMSLLQQTFSTPSK